MLKIFLDTQILLHKTKIFFQLDNKSCIFFSPTCVRKAVSHRQTILVAMILVCRYGAENKIANQRSAGAAA